MLNDKPLAIAGIVCLFMLHTSIAFASPAAEEKQQQAGKILYETGILPSGKVVSGTVQNDIKVDGAQLICSNCHGRSGMGSSESGIPTPTISGNVLFQPLELNRKELYTKRTLRPAYTAETLRRAIVEGIDSAGKPLDPLMPRYQMDDLAMDALTQYLATLSNSFSPGVTESEIHLATIVSNGVDPADKADMLEVLNAFAAAKNSNTRNETGRSKHSPFQREWHYESYRDWKLHVWELKGKPDSWQEQLEAHYRKTPVFAVVSGLSEHPWTAIQTFCENSEIPCLFPNTQIVPDREAPHFSFYFNRGIADEALALDAYLKKNDAREINVLQVYDDNPVSLVAAEQFRKAASADGSLIKLEELHLTNSQSNAALDKAIAAHAESIIVFWTNGKPVTRLAGHQETHIPTQIFMSSTMCNSACIESLPEEINNRITLLHAFHLPEKVNSKTRRSSHWLKSKNISLDNYALKINTFFAVNALSSSLKHIRGNFHREYLIERLEHMVDNMVIPTMHANISMATNQRHASKGVYIIPAKNNAQNNKADWIIP